MRRLLFAFALSAAIIGSSLPTAGAKTDNDSGKSGFKRAFVFHGTLSSVDGDGDTTPGPFVVTPTKANGNGKRYLANNPGDVTVAIAEGTKFYGAADDATDFAVGDEVKVKAKASETGAVAKKIKLKAEAEEEDPAPVV